MKNLESERLLLRHFHLEDASMMYENWPVMIESHDTLVGPLIQVLR